LWVDFKSRGGQFLDLKEVRRLFYSRLVEFFL
jgi:hypothetical protein